MNKILCAYECGTGSEKSCKLIWTSLHFLKSKTTESMGKQYRAQPTLYVLGLYFHTQKREQQIDTKKRLPVIIAWQTSKQMPPEL